MKKKKKTKTDRETNKNYTETSKCTLGITLNDTELKTMINYK